MRPSHRGCNSQEFIILQNCSCTCSPSAKTKGKNKALDKITEASKWLKLAYKKFSSSCRAIYSMVPVNSKGLTEQRALCALVHHPGVSMFPFCLITLVSPLPSLHQICLDLHQAGMSMCLKMVSCLVRKDKNL